MNNTQTIQTKVRKINKWLATGHLRHLSWQSVLLIVIGLALVVMPRLANLGEFVVFDEPLYWRWTNQFFKAVMAGDWANTLLGRGNPGMMVIVIQWLGLMVRYFADVLIGETSAQALAHLHLDQPVIVFGDLALRRLPWLRLNVAFVLLLLFLVYRQFGQKVTLVTTILLGLDAFLLSDLRTMRGDAMMSVLMTISAITLLIYLAEGGLAILVALQLGGGCLICQQILYAGNGSLCIIDGRGVCVSAGSSCGLAEQFGGWPSLFDRMGRHESAGAVAHLAGALGYSK